MDKPYKPKKGRSPLVCFRLPLSEYVVLSKATHRVKETVTDFVRTSVRERLAKIGGGEGGKK